MFNAEGSFDVVIEKAIASEPRFAKGPKDFDVCIKVKTEDDRSGWWRGEISNNFGKGNFADRTQAQITLENLRKLGLPNNDLTKLDTLVGKKCVAVVEGREYEGKMYYDVKYLNGDNSPTELSAEELQKRLAAFGATSSEPVSAETAAKAKAPKTSEANPFLA